MPEGLSLGFDLGGTQLRAALVEGCAVVKRAAAPTDVAGGPEAVMRQFSALADEVTPFGGMSSVIALGVSAPGPLDTVTGVVDRIPTLPGWDGFPLRQRLSDLFMRPVTVENDAVAAAYGEWKHGAGQGLSNLVYVTVSTGVGGGAIVDGRLLHGSRGMAAHVGHLRLAKTGPICACGSAGCFEAFASGTALGSRARAMADRDPSSYLGRIALQQRVEAQHAVDGARAGDAGCLALMKEEAEYLGLGFASIIHLFSPQRIITGGGVSQAFDLLSGHIDAVLKREVMAPFRDAEVVAAELGGNAGLIGAALLAKDRAGQAP